MLNDKMKSYFIGLIIEGHDQTRFGNYGGYPSDWTIDHDTVYCASVDHDGGPTLTVSSTTKFIEDNEDSLWEVFVDDVPEDVTTVEELANYLEAHPPKDYT